VKKAATMPHAPVSSGISRSIVICFIAETHECRVTAGHNRDACATRRI
jgi:hypothetical protein